MNKKKINKVIEEESGIILLQKESEYSFFEALFSGLISVASALYFLSRKKYDSIVLTEKRLVLIIKNKIYLEQKLNGNETFNYNGTKSYLEINNTKEVIKVGLIKLSVSYEEGNLIRKRLTEFKNRDQ